MDQRRAQRDGYMSSYRQLVDTFNTKAEDEGLNPEEANEVVNFECAHLFIFFRKHLSNNNIILVLKKFIF